MAATTSATCTSSSSATRTTTTTAENTSGDGDRVTVLAFWKPQEPNGWLGNWFTSHFTLDDKHFTCVEQWLMYSKAVLFNDRQSMGRISACNDPRKIKSLGRKVQNFDDAVWDANKHDILYRGLMAKFSQNQQLKNRLLATDKILVEASPVDRIYGIGMAADHPDIHYRSRWRGQNLLGNTLMEVRQALRDGSSS
ncbi:NADAR family protein [Pelomyxa schiedti]|nr:NADAR family protein [Pelomyxa schiedti]